MNNEKLQKIFEIYKEINQEEKLEIKIKINNYADERERSKPLVQTAERLGDKYINNNHNLSKDLTTLKNRLLRSSNQNSETLTPPPINTHQINSHQIILILRPNTFEVIGTIKNFTRDVMQKIMEEAKLKIDEEFVSLKFKLDDLKNRLI